MSLDISDPALNELFRACGPIYETETFVDALNERLAELGRDATRYATLRAANSRPPDEVDRVVDAAIADKQRKLREGIRAAIREYPH